MKKLLVLLAAVAFVVSFAIPAMAAEKKKKTMEERVADLEKSSAEWSFYGNARMATYFWDVEPEGVEGDTDLQWDLQGNSRLGANAKFGSIGGNVELGLYPQSGRKGNSEYVRVRRIYGTWNFGGGTLLVGKTYTPLCYFTSNQVADGDDGLIAYGTPYTDRIPMFMLSMAGLELALVQPKVVNIDDTIFDDTDTNLPRLEVAYKINLGPAHIKLLGGYQSYDLVAAGHEESLDAYAYGFGVTAPFGPAYFKGSLLLGNNVGNLGIVGAGTASATSATQIVDNDTLAYTAVLGFKASDMLSFELGYGHMENEDDVSNATKTEADSYYAQAVINIAKGFFVVPEIGKFDNKGTQERTYYGAKWQINF